MNSLFRETKNTRCVIPGNYRFIRSDLPAELSEDEKQWMIEHDITNIVDLRSREESERDPSCFECDERFHMTHFSVKAGEKKPGNVGEIADYLYSMIDTAFEDLVADIIVSEHGTLFFSGLGKDRAGVLSAVLLYNYQIPIQMIYVDYMLSGKFLEDEINTYVKEHPEENPEMIIPQMDVIEKLVNRMRGRICSNCAK